MADDDQCVLQSQDGQDFKVLVGVAKMNETLKNLIEDSGIDCPIPLPNITGKNLSKVLEYCKWHKENPSVAPADTTTKAADDKRTDDLCGWDLDFCKVEQLQLFELILAANYLDNKPLLDTLCKTVANMVKGKTPEQIRTMFNIKNDFTPEEEEQIRKENEVRVSRVLFFFSFNACVIHSGG